MIQKSSNTQVTVVGGDVDLLVLLIVLTPENKNIYFLKPGSGKIAKEIFSSKDSILLYKIKFYWFKLSQDAILQVQSSARKIKSVKKN